MLHPMPCHLAEPSVFIVATQLLHVATARDQHHAGHANEQTVLHDSRHVTELASE